MANILTASEAALIVAADADDAKLALMLPQVDAAVTEATGRDWTQDSPISPVAKRAAMCRLAVDYDLGAMNPQQTATMERAYMTACSQLEAIAVGIQALTNVNSASYVEDMMAYIASDTLGLNLIDYSRMRYTGRYNAAKALLDGRPSGGYADAAAVQTALDAAIKAESN